MCCSHDIDADGACCPVGVDACGVCGGVGTGCLGVAKIVARIELPSSSVIPESPFCADEGTFPFGSWCFNARQEFCDAFQESLFPTASTDEGSAEAGKFNCTSQFLLDSNTGSSQRKLMSASSPRALQQLAEPRVASIQFTLAAQKKFMAVENLVRVAATPIPGEVSTQLLSNCVCPLMFSCLPSPASLYALEGTDVANGRFLSMPTILWNIQGSYEGVLI